MTLQEAKVKEVLNNIWDFADAQDEEKGDVVDDAIIEAIKCMEELEQYRALGTVEEIEPYIRLAEKLNICDLVSENKRLANKIQFLEIELKEAREFKKYFDELYGEGLEVANWHKNGDLEPFDSFY